MQEKLEKDIIFIEKLVKVCLSHQNFLKYHAPSSNVEAKGEEKRYRVIKKSTKSFNKNFDFRKVHLNRLNTEFKQQFYTFRKFTKVCMGVCIIV